MRIAPIALPSNAASFASLAGQPVGLMQSCHVVPGHGYLSDEHEVTEYRDMVVIVRDRIQD